MRRIWRGPERRRQRPAERREMEEYTQLTIADWLEMKTKLKQELLAASASFVRIGYMLRRIQDEELYKTDGYKSIADFAEQECGLSASAVSRFIAINKKYSIDGYSDRLRTEFTFLGQSKLAEMLTLPDSDMELIRPETERSQIRDLKRFNKEEPEPGKVISVNQLIEAFFHDNRQDLNEIFRRGGIYTMRDIKALAELLNPAGNRTYRKGLFMLFMYPDVLKLKKFGSVPMTMEWEEFYERMGEIFRDDMPAEDLWAAHFGEEVPDEKEQKEIPAEAEKADEGAGAAEGTERSAAEDKGADRGSSDLIPEGDRGDGQNAPAGDRRPAAEGGEGRRTESTEGGHADTGHAGGADGTAVPEPEKIAPESRFAPAQKSEETAENKGPEPLPEASPEAEKTVPEPAAEMIYYAGDRVILQAEVTAINHTGHKCRVRLQSGMAFWLDEDDIERKVKE